MDNLSNIDADERSPLETAWEYYADIVFSDFNYRDELRSLRKQSQQGSPEEADIVFKLLERREKSLKNQFLGFLENGYFNAYGCDFYAAPASGETIKLHKSIFDTRVQGFEINWDENWVEVHGKRFTGLEVSPNLAKLKESYPERFHSPLPLEARDIEVNQNKPIARSPDKHRERPGAKSREEIRQTVLAECDRQFSDFFVWSNRQQLAQANKTAQELFSDSFDGRGFGQTSYLNSRKYYLKNQ